MQLIHLTVLNFLALRLVDMDLSQNKVHLIAGTNEAGKSSLQEAIRFAMLGEVLRVEKKSEYKAMVTDGAKKGSVEVKLLQDDGTLSEFGRDVSTGKELVGSGVVPNIELALDAHLFSRMKGGARRNLLFQLTGTSIKPDDIKRRMLVKKLNEEKIDMVLPMLRTGAFDGAHKEASRRTTEARGAWKGLTGENYGSVKAETWKMAPPAYSKTALKKARDAKNKLDKELAALHQEKGRLSGGGISLAEKQRLEMRAGKFSRLNKRIGELRDQIADQEQAINKLNEELAKAHAMYCPDCGAVLTVENNHLVSAGEEDVLSTDQVSTYRASLKQAHEALGQLCGELSDTTGQMGAARSAQKALEEMSDDAEEADPDKTKAVDDQIAGTQEKLATAAGEVTELEHLEYQAENAGDITAKAKRAHQDVVEWDAISQALAPDGIQAEILAQAVKPVNDRLRQTATNTGWKQVAIQPDMSIAVDGRPYALMSESARWRADAAITDAISHLSGLRLMVLDRIDVLDLPSRSTLIKWVNGIQDDYDTVLLLGTLKEIPGKSDGRISALPDGFAAHWLHNGEIVETTQAA